jgi:hypothetical protein
MTIRQKEKNTSMELSIDGLDISSGRESAEKGKSHPSRLLFLF